MDLTLSLNFWFLVSLCLIFLIIGMMIGGRSGGSRRYR